VKRADIFPEEKLKSRVNKRIDQVFGTPGSVTSEKAVMK
jgi:hypothetical protein